jgi:hypothetical protein
MGAGPQQGGGGWQEGRLREGGSAAIVMMRIFAEAGEGGERLRGRVGPVEGVGKEEIWGSMQIGLYHSGLMMGPGSMSSMGSWFCRRLGRGHALWLFRARVGGWVGWDRPSGCGVVVYLEHYFCSLAEEWTRAFALLL